MSRRAVGLSCAALVAALLVPWVPVGADDPQRSDAVVWLTGTSIGEREKVRFRAPLEWLARVDEGKGTAINIDDIEIDCAGLWSAYKDLPAGETREVRKGVSEDGDSYQLFVASESARDVRAEGKLHILSRDPDGKVTDVRFPLDIANLLHNLGDMVASWFGADIKIDTGGDRPLKGLASLRELAGYGPFTAIEKEGNDGSRTVITVE